MSKCKFKVGDYVIGKTYNYPMTGKGWIGEVIKVYDNGKFEARGKSGMLGLTFNFVNLDPKDFDLYTKDQPTKIVITTDGKTTTAKMYRDKTVIGVQTTKCHPDDRFDFMVGARIAFDRLVGKKKETPSLKIEVGKKYKIKDYDEVFDHCSISRYTWKQIQEAGYVTVSDSFDKSKYICNTGYRGNWVFLPEAFECEWEEPTYYNGKVVCVDPRNNHSYTKGKVYQFVDGTLTNDSGYTYGFGAKDCVGFKSFKEWQDWSSAEWLEVVE